MTVCQNVLWPTLFTILTRDLVS